MFNQISFVGHVASEKILKPLKRLSLLLAFGTEQQIQCLLQL